MPETIPVSSSLSNSSLKRNDKKVKTGTSSVFVDPTTLEATFGPPFMPDVLLAAHSIELRTTKPSLVDHVSPGAVRVPGIHSQDIHQPRSSHHQQDLFTAIIEEAQQSHNDSEIAFEDPEEDRRRIPDPSVVAAVVDDDQLFHEWLFRRPHDMVEAENIETVIAEPFDSNTNKEKTQAQQRRTAMWRWTAIVAIGTLLVVASVVTGVLVSRYRSRVSRVAAFTSILLTNNASNNVALTTQGSPQFFALYWIANSENYLSTSSPVQAIVDRFSLTAFFESLDGTNWTDRSKFLSKGVDLCAWNDNNDKGAFCNSTTASSAAAVLHDGE